VSVYESKQEVKVQNPPQTKKGGKEPELVINGDTLENTPMHYTLTHGFFALATFCIGTYLSSTQTIFQGGILLGVFIFATFFSDMFSGVFHWSVDNYGNEDTPLFGSVIAAFQGHHTAPWTITHRPFENNVHKICKAAIPIQLVSHALPFPVGLKFFVSLWLCFQVVSQELHKYSHMLEPPKWIQAIQSKNLIISRKYHGLHHCSPFEGNYCIITGWCNPFLDGIHFFRALEKIVFEITGVEPNCWKLDAAVKEEALSIW